MFSIQSVFELFIIKFPLPSLQRNFLYSLITVRIQLFRRVRIRGEVAEMSPGPPDLLDIPGKRATFTSGSEEEIRLGSRVTFNDQSVNIEGVEFQMNEVRLSESLRSSSNDSVTTKKP